MADTERPSGPTPSDAPGSPTPSGSTGVHLGGADWPVQAADAVVQLVGQVRDRTVEPAFTVARAIVYGLLAGILGSMAAVLVLVALVRFIDSYLPGEVWSTYLLIGAALTGGGFALWSQRRAPDPASPS